MEIRILGEVNLYGPDGKLPIPRVGERILLAVLAIHVGEDVETTTLLRLVGEGGVEQIASRTLVEYVGTIRAALEAAGGTRAMLPDARRRRGTYRLNIDPNLVDYHRFRMHTQAAHRYAATGEHRAAARSLRQAIAEWNGRPLAGIDRPPVDGLRHELQAECRAATRDLLTQQLHLGEHTEVIRTARRMIDEYPTDDMVALGIHGLARGGRRAEIARFCHHATQRLQALLDTNNAELGPELQELVDALVGDPRQSYRLLPAESTPAAITAPSDTAAVRFTLPADTIAFTGRAEELAAITATVMTASQRGGVVAIHAIDGMPGVGKTTLAVHAAHEIAHRYPDRRLFVDLRAHTPGQPAVDPVDALAELLRADGVDPRQLPNGLQARSGMWRDRMAGRRALLVLDNAASTTEVAPLLPGTETALVLITSRRHLGDLRQAAHLRLRVLPPDDAAAMFLRLAPRAAADPEAVAALVSACGYLPLAIAIVASRFAARNTWTVTDLLAETYAGRGRLLTVKSEDITIQMAFDLSYRHLPAERQRFFRLLSLTPGVDIDGYAAAALTGTSYDHASAHLDELYNDHLLDETAPNRYRMHDLIRTYAHILTTTTDPEDARDQALDRLLGYYQHTANRANTITARYTRPGITDAAAPGAAPALPDWDSAIGWLRTERANLLACLHHTTNPHRVVGLTTDLATLLSTDEPWGTAADLYRHAAAAAAQTGDQVGQANALQELGRVRRLTGDYSGANSLHRQAHDIYLALGDRLGQANALYELGRMQWLTGSSVGANSLLQQAHDIYLALGHRLGQADVLFDLGRVRWLTADYPGANDLFRQAHDIYLALGDRLGQANALYELGHMQWLTGNYSGANSLLQRAHVSYLALGHRLGQAGALYCLGRVQSSNGDFSLANNLYQQAHDVYHALGYQHGQAFTRVQLGVVRYLTGDHAGAEDLLQQALIVLRELGVRDDEAEALNHLGTLRRLTGYPDQAHTLHHQALTLARSIQYRIEEARALEGIGRAAAELANPTTAVTHLRKALQLYQELGVPEAARVTAALTSFGSTPDSADDLLAA